MSAHDTGVCAAMRTEKGDFWRPSPLSDMKATKNQCHKSVAACFFFFCVLALCVDGSDHIVHANT